MKSQPDHNTNLYINCFSSCIGTLVAEITTLPLCTIKTIYQNNKTFTIEALNFSSTNNYQENPKLNNSVLKRPFIKYSEIMSGGNLNFQMTNK